MEYDSRRHINDHLTLKQQQQVRDEVEAFRLYQGLDTANQQCFQQAMRNVRQAIQEHLFTPHDVFQWDDGNEGVLPCGCFYGESFFAWGAETETEVITLLKEWRSTCGVWGELTPLEEILANYVEDYEGTDNPVLAWFLSEVIQPYIPASV